MVLNYDFLKKLPENKLLEGLNIYYENSQDLYNTAELLAKENIYSVGTSLLILSIEELVKAYGIYLVLVDVTDKNSINACFKKTDEENSVHETRLKHASGINYVVNIINNSPKITEERIEEIFKENIQGKKFKNENEFFNCIMNALPSVFKEMPHIRIDNTEVDNHMKNKENWYLSAQKLKEKGFYSDWINNNWSSPKNMTLTEYLASKEKNDEVQKSIGNNIKLFISGGEAFRKLAKLVVPSMLAHRAKSF